METFVIDASTLLSGHDDPTMTAALSIEALEREHIFVAPALLASETGHVIHKKRPQRFGNSTAERAEMHEELLRDIRLVESDARRRLACGHVCARTGLTWYDAEYVALADVEGARLITEDARLLGGAREVLGPARALTLAEAVRAHVTADSIG